MSHSRLTQADVIVVGAGIIGASCAHQLAQAGYRILLLDNQSRAATAAGMGHLVCMDDNPAELALSSYSIAQWRPLLEQMPASCAWHTCGTLWIAAHPEEMSLAEQKQQRLASVGIQSALLSAQQLQHIEPMLRQGLTGGLRVPSEGILYAPNVAQWLVQQGKERVTLRHAEVVRLEEQSVVLADGETLSAPAIILANGIHAQHLLPELPLQPKKGQLAITDRYPLRVHHQLVELGYVASAHANSGTSVAFNVQPRPTGQLLIGSSRQFNTLDSTVEMPVLQAMLQRALHYLPRLAEMNLIRSWSGFRATSPDNLPLLGAHPRYKGLWLAVGHEGLGVTTATGSAQILTALLQGHTPPIDATPYLANRFLSTHIPLAVTENNQ